MSNKMWGARYAEGPDAIMEEINVSIDVDRHMYAQDIAASKAHTAMLAAQALAIEDSNKALALELALKAHKLDPALVPAAAVAARVLVSQASQRKAAKIIRETWAAAPHPELAEVQANPGLHFNAGGPSSKRDLNVLICKNVAAVRVQAGVLPWHPWARGARASAPRRNLSPSPSVRRPRR